LSTRTAVLSIITGGGKWVEMTIPADAPGLAGAGVGLDLDRWAHNCLPVKNTLTADDVRRVEKAQAKLAAEADMPEAAPSPDEASYR
jgi:hypothetical protein